MMCPLWAQLAPQSPFFSEGLSTPSSHPGVTRNLSFHVRRSPLEKELAASLPDMEADCQGGPTFNLVEHKKKLKDRFPTFDILGFPVTRRYVMDLEDLQAAAAGRKALSETLFATRLHEVFSDKAKFALAVHVHDFGACNIGAAWVYVAVATPRGDQ